MGRKNTNQPARIVEHGLNPKTGMFDEVEKIKMLSTQERAQEVVKWVELNCPGANVNDEFAKRMEELVVNTFLIEGMRAIGQVVAQLESQVALWESEAKQTGDHAVERMARVGKTLIEKVKSG